ncbi:MAG TPA: substrate-binding domain-containing protein [Pedobacter sp.]|jgi:phosphate transport system substrate-binding protein
MRFAFISVLALIFLACNNNQENKPAVIEVTKILVDESFEPIIDDQYLVFENSYPQDKVKLIYEPEVKLVNELLSGKVSLGIMSRKLSSNEHEVFEKKKIQILNYPIATDAIALITHQSSKDSTITVDEIKDVMSGSSTGKSLVFDNPNSSTVRYLKELSKIKDLPAKGIYALKTSEDVIKYVYNNPGTIGVIGYNWMKQPTIELEPLVKQLKNLAIKNSTESKGEGKYYKPSQDNLALGLYPLSRKLYYIDCTGGTARSGFAAFVTGERGQRLILKSGLLPVSMPPREIIIRKTITK